MITVLKQNESLKASILNAMEENKIKNGQIQFLSATTLVNVRLTNNKVIEIMGNVCSKIVVGNDKDKVKMSEFKIVVDGQQYLLKDAEMVSDIKIYIH